MELDVAIKLLTSILFKRGESTRETEVDALVRWTQKKDKLPEPVLLFSIMEWREVGNCLWDTTIEGGREGKEVKAFGATWWSIVNTLETMKAEKKVAAAAIEALGGDVVEKPIEQKGDSPKPSLLATLFGVGHTRPMKGMSAPACSTVQELLDKTEDKPEVTSQGSVVTEPNPEEAVEPPQEGGAASPAAPIGAVGGARPKQRVATARRSNSGGTKALSDVYPPLPETSLDKFEEEVPPVSPTTPPMLNLGKDPILQRWSDVHDAILEGDWKVTSSLACPVVINNIGARNWDVIYGSLMIIFSDWSVATCSSNFYDDLSELAKLL
ncbi:uncharacterized protein LOC121080690 [Falco naumanni]|uniref:uncharacterized protein LOC121080690 n=1 Tax=Falco naumanni TaxID=148594 RepID=UPI001ADE2AA4|nr:uncharacterized protein LOC121080690 [Falco naumanni]